VKTRLSIVFLELPSLDTLLRKICYVDPGDVIRQFEVETLSTLLNCLVGFMNRT
jgi:hypothetical protein